MNTRPVLMSEEKEKLVDKILELQDQLKALQEKYDAILKKKSKEPTSSRDKKPDFIKSDKPKGLPPHRWGQKKGHPGCTRPTPTQIDRTVDQTLNCCPACQGPLNETNDASSHIQEDIIPARVEVTRFVHHSYWCRACHKDVVAPPAPDEVPHGYLGPQALATMVCLKYHVAIPTNKIQSILHDLCGLTVSPGAITQSFQRLAGYLHIESDQIREAIRLAMVKHVDETGWTINGVAIGSGRSLMTPGPTFASTKVVEATSRSVSWENSSRGFSSVTFFTPTTPRFMAENRNALSIFVGKSANNGVINHHRISPDPRKKSNVSWQTPIVWLSDDSDGLPWCSLARSGASKRDCLRSPRPRIPTPRGSD